MDKFPQIGDGITPDSSKMRVLLGIRYNLAKPLLFGKSTNCIVKNLKEKVRGINSVHKINLYLLIIFIDLRESFNKSKQISTTRDYYI